MVARNAVTGDKIQTKVKSKAYYESEFWKQSKKETRRGNGKRLVVVDSIRGNRFAIGEYSFPMSKDLEYITQADYDSLGVDGEDVVGDAVDVAGRRIQAGGSVEGYGGRSKGPVGQGDL